MIAIPKHGTASPASVPDADAQLMLRARDGDLAAFDELTRKHRPRVVAVITSQLGSGYQSEDLAQDVFLRAFRARKTYVASAKFSTWLFTITNNVVLNARRKLARSRETQAGFRLDGDCDSLDAVLAVSRTEPLELAIRKETQRLVRTAVARLCDRQRVAISLVCFHGHSYLSAARQLRLSESALKALVYRARMNLRCALASVEK